MSTFFFHEADIPLLSRYKFSECCMQKKMCFSARNKIFILNHNILDTKEAKALSLFECSDFVVFLAEHKSVAYNSGISGKGGEMEKSFFPHLALSRYLKKMSPRKKLLCLHSSRLRHSFHLPTTNSSSCEALLSETFAQNGNLHAQNFSVQKCPSKVQSSDKGSVRNPTSTNHLMIAITHTHTPKKITHTHAHPFFL